MGGVQCAMAAVIYFQIVYVLTNPAMPGILKNKATIRNGRIVAFKLPSALQSPVTPPFAGTPACSALALFLSSP